MKRYGLGFLIGALSLAAVAAVELGFGLIEISGYEQADAGRLGLLVLFGLIGALTGALLEEMVFRGALLSHCGSVPLWMAILLISVPFAGLHLLNSGFGYAFVFVAIIGSTFFALIRIVTGDLFFAIGWHAAWNFMQYAVIGLATSDAPHAGHALIQVSRAPGAELWLGEGRSIEGGLIAGGMILLSAGLAYVRLRRLGSRLTDRTRELLFPNGPAPS